MMVEFPLACFDHSTIIIDYHTIEIFSFNVLFLLL